MFILAQYSGDTYPDSAFRDYKKDSKNVRYNFQTDLACALIKHTLERDHGGKLDTVTQRIVPLDFFREEGEEDSGDVPPAPAKPAWMRQLRPHPCDCGECYHCTCGLTNGVGHKPMETPREARKRKRNSGIGFPNALCVHAGVGREHVRVNAGTESQTCYLCYHHRVPEEHPAATTYKARRMLCKNTQLKCAGCDVYVCDKCWENFDHTR